MKKKILQVGITGGIGSGKSTICKIFELLNIPVYYADDQAKWLMENDGYLVEAIKLIFGEEAYHATGKLNRAYIASIAFQDKEKLFKLNAVVHPAVGKDGIDWHNAQYDVPYTLKEAALIFESGSYQLLDKIITVTAPESVRINRVVLRDGSTEEEVKARIDKQLPDSEKIAKSDFVINNDGDQLLVPQVLKIHEELKKDEDIV